MKRMKGPSWGLIVAMVLMLVAGFCVTASTRPYIESFKGKAFAMQQAEEKGFGHWPLIFEGDDSAGELRFVFKSPTDGGLYKDCRVKFDGGKWGVTLLSEYRYGK